MLSSQRLHLAGQAFSPHLLKPTFSALQPALAGPGNFQGNLSIPVNSMSGSSQASAPLAPLSEPPPFQILPDIYQPRNNLTDINSTCLVGPSATSISSLVEE